MQASGMWNFDITYAGKSLIFQQGTKQLLAEHLAELGTSKFLIANLSPTLPISPKFPIKHFAPDVPSWRQYLGKRKDTSPPCNHTSSWSLQI